MPSSIDLAARLSDVVSVQQEILGTASDAARLEALVVMKAAEMTGGDGGMLDLVDGDDLVCHAASGAAKADQGTRAPARGSLPASAVETRRALRCDDVEVDPRVDGAACLALGIRSMISAPLLQGDAAIGALSAFSSAPSAFDDLDVYTLQLLAGMTSSAVLLAHELRERRASEERYRMLFERNIAGVFRTTRDGRILDCNDAFVGYLGYTSREELLARPSWDLYHSRSDRQTMLERLERDAAMTNLRVRLRRKDGSAMIAVVNVSLIPAEDGDAQLLGTVVAE
jgi:PAS domain S-box-containing protein